MMVLIKERVGIEMKYVKQFCIILMISFIGELCNQMIPLPVPASIYGLGILFAGLLLGWVKLGFGQGNRQVFG